MKFKAIIYLTFVLGLIFLQFSVISSCQRPIYNPTNVIKPLSSQYHASLDSPSGLPYAGTNELEEKDNETEKKWKTVAIFEGEGNKTTPSFHISGIEWRINLALDTEQAVDSELMLFIYSQDIPSAIWQTLSYSDTNDNIFMALLFWYY